MTTKAEALDRLIDAIAGEDVPMNSQTVAGRLEQLAEGIGDGSIPVGGGGRDINVAAPFTYAVTGTGSQFLANHEILVDEFHEGNFIAYIELDSEHMLAVNGYTICAKHIDSGAVVINTSDVASSTVLTYSNKLLGRANFGNDTGNAVIADNIPGNGKSNTVLLFESLYDTTAEGAIEKLRNQLENCPLVDFSISKKLTA